jgi:hypothetical protein
MTDTAEPKLPLKQRLQKLYDRYGTVAIVTYFSLSFVTWLGFTLAIYFGFTSDSSTGVWSAMGLGWVALKASMVIRIPIVLAITPFIARFVEKRRANKPKPPPELELSEEEERNLRLDD